MSRYTVLDASSTVVNIIEWDGKTDFGLSSDHTVRPSTPDDALPVSVDQATAAALRQRAGAALQANITYLAVASPSNAQVVAQVNALTKECSALIRLLLNQLDSTSGT